MKLPKSKFFLLFLTLVVLAIFGFLGYLSLKSGKLSLLEKLQVTKSLPKIENPEIEQKKFLLSPKDPKEKQKTTLYGKIVKVEDKILTLENQGKVKVEIAESARFYRITPGIGMEQIPKENFEHGKTTLAGNLSSSDIADYQAEIFTLTDKPTLLWREE